MSRVLVTGGAGYVGSHIVRRLVAEGRDVVVLDNLAEGHRAAIDGVPLIEGDLGDAATLERVLGAGDVAFIVHMAASCLVAESVAAPSRYYRDNVIDPLVMLDAARRHRVSGVVFSSSAAVYGEPTEVPIREDHPCLPTNPYGETKLVFERALAWHHRAYGIRSVSLRYFNAAGAHPDGDIGEDHAEESHLIPRLLKAVLSDGSPVPIHGADYPTSDGTCVRDYVHVVDLAEAHVLALRAMESGSIDVTAFNLGNGEGFSVNEVIATVAKVTGEHPPVDRAPRRPGDPAILVAAAERAQRELGWSPRFPTLEEIVASAWKWHHGHPQGYGNH